jgi:hypothetical protein
MLHPDVSRFQLALQVYLGLLSKILLSDQALLCP